MRLVASPVILSCILVGALALAAPALGARGHAFHAAFGEQGTADGDFQAPSGVAVNEAGGDVYIVDQGNNRVEYFTSTGTYIGQFDGSTAPTGAFSSPEAIAVDNSTDPLDPSAGDVYVADNGHHVIDKFSATGAYIGQMTATPTGPFGTVYGIAIGATGAVSVYRDAEIDTFDHSLTNEFQASFESKAYGFGKSGFALDSEGNFYVVHQFIKLVARINGAGEVQNESVDGEEANAISVNLTTNDLYVAKHNGVDRLDSHAGLIEQFGSEQLTAASGIAVNSSTETVYVADAAANVVDVYTPRPPSAPAITNESAAEVTSRQATAVAEIDPRGTSAEYRFEYGTCPSLGECSAAAYEGSAPAPDRVAGSGFGPVSVSAELEKLLPGRVYHYRTVAHNSLGTTYGAEQTFTTQSVGGGPSLPDGRAWELVSAPDKHGALIEAINERDLIQAAANGDAIAYVADAPTEGKPGGYATGVQVLSTRGKEGWSSQDIATPHDASVGPATGQGFEYRFFSSDLSDAIVEPQGPFSPLMGEEATSQASERTVYRRADSTCAMAPTTCYTALVTATNTTSGDAIEGDLEAATGDVDFVGATTDASHIVLSSSVPLTETTPTATKGGLYEWAGGSLSLVSILPGAGNAPAGLAVLGADNEVARHAISDDGSRIFWSEKASTIKHLYMRDTALGQTVQLDAVQGGSGENEGGLKFQTAASDGSRAFFTDGQNLTADSGGTPSKPDLYECEIIEVGGILECKLTDLTPPHSGERAFVQGGVVGSSEDGSWVYFLANGVLAGGAVPGSCEQSQSKLGATCNLYVRHGNATRLIAILSGADSSTAGSGELTELSKLTARVSPDGHYLAFMSQQDLTGYDTRDAISGKPDEEVYLYHAEDSGPGRLACASCDPSGARPVGVEYSHINHGLVGGDRVWEETSWIAANIPGWTSFASGRSLYQSRYLSNDGRLFFNSHDALTAQDVNGNEDVYEFEPVGVGAGGGDPCALGSASYSERSSGCVSLVSSGSSAEESAFLDASESGGDVFFLTTAKLLPQDYDASVDVYDAHECTEGSPCVLPPSVPPPACATGDSCKPAVSPQPAIFGAPSSATFSGAQKQSLPNTVSAKTKPLTRAQKLARALKICSKKPKGKRAACRRRARHNYAPLRKASKSLGGVN